MAAPNTKRFADFDEEEYQNILQDKDSDRTKKATKTSVNIFREYLAEKGRNTQFQTLTKEEIALQLAKFYIEVRRVDGTHYKTSSLNSIRAGINRYLKSEYFGVIDIISDPEFSRANAAYKAATVELKKIGKGCIEHHEDLSSGDLEKLYTSGVFDQDTPLGLQRKFWFEISLYFCRRGRENLRCLKKDMFRIDKDENGIEFVTQNIDEMTKKTREDNLSSRTNSGRMYTTGSSLCPVATYKKYLAKLNPESEFLFQTPKTSAPSCPTAPWYKKTPLGKNPLGSMMSSISKDAGLSVIYTNHCVRATCIKILDTGGFAGRDICQVSGHNNEGSLSSYTGRVTSERKLEMSATLGRAIGVGDIMSKPKPKVHVPAPATATVPDTVDLVAPMSTVTQVAPRPAPVALPESVTVPAVQPPSDDEITFDLGVGSQGSLFDFDFEETEELQQVNVGLGAVVNNVPQLNSQQQRQPLNVVDVPQPQSQTVQPNQPSIDRASTSSSSRRVTSRVSRRMQVQTPAPFVFKSCNVTINYINNN